MVEVLAVRAGLWSWAEPGHLGVPLIGILGWAFFAASADAILATGRRLRHVALIALAPLATHALLVAAWWGALRWVLRGALGDASLVGLGALSALALGAVLAARRRGWGMDLGVAGPRMLAASLFFALLLASAPSDGRLWIHVALVAAPYAAATRYALPARAASRAARRPAT
jgi:hypothetical protein